MHFSVLAHAVRPPAQGRSRAFLLTDNWDDWFKFSTLYVLIVFDADGGRHDIGGVKIGQFNMEEGQRRPSIANNFEELDDRFFSLGQDDSYYDRLNGLGAQVRDEILRGLKDVALDLELFERALDEKVTGTSLLRSVSRATVLGQFNRMARGGVRLTRYEFSYRAPNTPRRRIESLTLDFVVEPESQPPTNIHVLIGRNGVGKTTILNNMTRAIVEKDADASEVGEFSAEVDNDLEDLPITNLVSVTFSAFDPFEPLPIRQDKSAGVQYAYIGLKRVGLNEQGNPLPPKSPERLSREFGNSVSVCRQGARSGRWRRALEMLEADPIFRDAEVAALASEDVRLDD